MAAAILFYMALNYIGLVGGAISSLVKILSPFIWGLVISYLLGPLVELLQTKLFDPLARRLYRKNKRNDGSGFARAMAVLMSELIMLLIIATLFYLILPQLYSSIETIVVNSPTYIDNTIGWIAKLLEDYPSIEAYVTRTLGDANQWLTGWLQTKLLPQMGTLLSSVGAGLYYLLMAVYNLVIGIIVSIYMLGSKERFRANSMRVLYTVLSVESAKKFLKGLEFTDRTFMGFINGKLLDSAIIGLICYVCCAILRMPYTLLVSVIVGVTNVIPFFGPFIGAIPCTLLILLVNPIKGLIFVAFIIVLQQVDGNIIGPKVLGTTVGINGFWVMFSIIIGAGLFGFWGMLLGVPVFVLIYTLFDNYVERKLKRSELPWETGDYMDLDYIDPVTLVPIRYSEEAEEE